MNTTKKTYFASDFHLGIPNHAKSLVREKRVVKWLNSIEKDAEEIFLVGDLFDFWFEYKYVIPKGFTRLLGKLCELHDKGIIIHIFHGNHDLWQFGYFEKEIGCKVHSKPVTMDIHGKRFYIAHGDGVGPEQHGFKFILSVYRNPFFQWLFAIIHPNMGIAIANWFSHRSKLTTSSSEAVYLGDEKEYQVLHAKAISAKQHFDYFIFGHRHLPFNKRFEKYNVINLGDWFSNNTYAVFDGNNVELRTFEG